MGNLPSLSTIFTWVQDQAVYLFLIFMVFAVVSIVYRKSWFTGIWTILGFVCFGIFLYNTGVIEGLSNTFANVLKIQR